MERFRGGLVIKAHRLVYHSTQSNKEEEEKSAVPSFPLFPPLLLLPELPEHTLWGGLLYSAPAGSEPEHSNAKSGVGTKRMALAPAHVAQIMSVRETPSCLHCRGTSLIRKRLALGPYSSLMPRDLWWA